MIALRDSTDAALFAYVLAEVALESPPKPRDAESELQTMLLLEEIRAAAKRVKAQRDALS